MLNLMRPITPAVRNLIFAILAVTISEWLLAMTGSPLGDVTSLTPTVLRDYQLWRVATYAFGYPLGTTLPFLFGMLILWMFGSAVEEEIGTRRFYWLFGVCTLAGALGAAIAWTFGMPIGLAGATVPLIGVELAFCWLYPHATVQMLLVVLLIPMRASTLGWVTIAISFASSPVLIPAYLASILAAYLALKYRLGAPSPGRFGLRKKNKPKASRLAAVTDVRNKVTPLRPSLDVVPSKKLSASEREVDRILDKLRDEGMGSLTPEERETLDQHSRQLRQRDGM